MQFPKGSDDFDQECTGWEHIGAAGDDKRKEDFFINVPFSYIKEHFV